MEGTYKFYKEGRRWYIDLPEFITGGHGDKDDLEMVAGADKLLNYLSGGNESVRVKFSDSRFPGAQAMLTKLRDTPPDGAEYTLEGQKIWLCNVTSWVFKGKFPQYIYLAVPIASTGR